jgi:CBS domain-containing protein
MVEISNPKRRVNVATVQDILDMKNSSVASISKADVVLDAAKKMNDSRIGSLVVTEGDNVVGIFTERDILTRIVAAGRNPGNTPVGEVMSTPVACCRRDTTLEECRAVMTQKRIRHLPVVEEKKLLGIVTSGDILARRIDVHEETIRYLNEYIYGHYL